MGSTYTGPAPARRVVRQVPTGLHRPPTVVYKWLATQCPHRENAVDALDSLPQEADKDYVVGGVMLHPSHALGLHRGMAYCLRCGGVGAFAPRKLGHPCRPPTQAGRRALQRIADDQLPHGTPRWPDSAPIGGIGVPL